MSKPDLPEKWVTSNPKTDSEYLAERGWPTRMIDGKHTLTVQDAMGYLIARINADNQFEKREKRIASSLLRIAAMAIDEFGTLPLDATNEAKSEKKARRDEEIQKLYRQGLKRKQIAYELECSPSTVSRALRGR